MNARLLLAAFLVLLGVSPFAHGAATQDQWWSNAYPYRYSIRVPAGGAPVDNAYSVSIQFDHATEVSLGRSLANGNDVRVLHWTGAAWQELDRVLDPQSTWNSSSTRIWFRTRTALAADATDDNYYLYFGNPTPATPIANADNIFLLYDGFDGTTLNLARWNVSGAHTVNSGRLTIPDNTFVRSDNAFGMNTIWEANVSIPEPLPGNGNGNYYFWLATNAALNAGNHVGFYANHTDYYAVSGAGSYDINIIDAGTPSNFQTFAFTREITRSRYFRDGTQLRENSSSLPTANLPVGFMNDANTTGNVVYDWVRVRRYRNPEPLLSLAPVEGLLPAPVAEWRLDEAGWGTVQDSSGNGLHGSAVGGVQTSFVSPVAARNGSPGTCRYGNFDGSNDYLQIADNSRLDLPNQATISAWVYPRSYGSELRSIVSKDENYEFHLNSSGRVFFWWSTGNLTSTGTVPLNTWTHIVVTWQSGAQRIYINGELRGSSNMTGTLTTNNDPVHIGQDQLYPGRYFHGGIDEVRIYNVSLSAAQVSSVYHATHPCGLGASKFVVNHDRSGVNCAPERVDVSVRDTNNNAVVTYNQQITLTTGTGRGAWSLISGSGTLADGTPNDGVATYQWASGESAVAFALSYPEGTRTFNIEVAQTNNTLIRDDDTEGLMSFAPSAFVLTSAPLASNAAAPFPLFTSPQTAGTSFPIYIAKYGATPNTAGCTIVSEYHGTKLLALWSTYADPSSSTTRVAVTSGTTTASVGTDESNATTMNVDFVNGRAVLMGRYKDVGLLALTAKDAQEISLTPAVDTRGSTSNFIVKPASFAIEVPAQTWAATNSAATRLVAAGDPFAIRISARDSDGDITPNYGRESVPQSVILAPTVVQPNGGSNGTISSPPLTFVGGAATLDIAWSEVGLLRLQAFNNDYLAAGVSATGTSANIGRFVPADFLVSYTGGHFGASCTSFTYLGQPIRYQSELLLTVTARNRSGATTQNYRSADGYFKLSSSSVTQREYSLLDNTAITHANPPPAEWGFTPLNNGTAALRFSTGSGALDGLIIPRAAPREPFDAQVQLRFRLSDADNVQASAVPVEIGAGTGIAFPSPQQRYGRLTFRNAIGSELLDLNVPMQTEHFVNSVAGFVPSMGDMCSTATLQLTNLRGNLDPGETCVQDIGAPGISTAGCSSAAPFGRQYRATAQNGALNLWLRAPGHGNGGTLTITAPTTPAWLTYDWDSSLSGFETPSAIATFGIFQGNSKRIYQREVVRK